MTQQHIERMTAAQGLRYAQTLPSRVPPLRVPLRVLLLLLLPAAVSTQQMVTHGRSPLDSDTAADGDDVLRPPSVDGGVGGRGRMELVGTGIVLGTVHVLSGPDHLSALLTLSGSNGSEAVLTHSRTLLPLYLFQSYEHRPYGCVLLGSW
eukprot:SAG31_NODE_6177_length_2136_cov_1.305351_3_plen_150_part_00